MNNKKEILTINPELELEIRRGYSEYLPKFQSLELWLKNLLSEICRHTITIYDCSVRIKTIESIIKKVEKKQRR